MLLGIEKKFLDHLSGDRMQPRDCLEKVLSHWLKAPQSTASWASLMEVLHWSQNQFPGVYDRVIGFLAKPEIYDKYK